MTRWSTPRSSPSVPDADVEAIVRRSTFDVFAIVIRSLSQDRRPTPSKTCTDVADPPSVERAGVTALRLMLPRISRCFCYCF